MNKLSSFKIEEGFVVASYDLSNFLEEKLTLLGFNSKEITDFVTYWGSYLQSSPWILVRFDKKVYEAMTELNIDPKPEVLIRVFAIFKPLKQKITVKPQTIERYNSSLRERSKLTVVEWGGVVI